MTDANQGCVVGSDSACEVVFQAEDGIRGLVRSRGLGDVYKRQKVHCEVSGVGDVEVADDEQCVALVRRYLSYFPQSVSYTHLTLPTSDLV